MWESNSIGYGVVGGLLLVEDTLGLLREGLWGKK